MPTTENWYVDPDATGAGTGADWTNAYTSINAATDAKAANLTVADKIMIFNCRSSAGTADTTTLSFSSGWTCDATRYIVIRATSGHEALKTGWSTSRYRISVTDAAAISTTATALVVYFEHLQIERVWISVSWDYVFPVNSASAGTNLYLNSCRMRTNNANTGIIALVDADCTMYLWDCILDGTSRHCFNISNGTGYMYNCICQGAGTDAIIIAAGKTAVFKNVASYNNTDDFQDNSGGTATIDYCASDDGDGTNAVAPSGADWDNEFVDSATNGDYTIVVTGNCFEGGDDDPGAGLYSEDMDGDAWVSPWSIGVDQGGAVAWTKDFADSITLSDSLALTLGLNKADTITLSDSLTNEIGINKTDSITLSDQLTKAVDLIKADSITLSDSLSKAFEKPLTDNITLSDLLSKTMDIVSDDSIVLSDSLTKGIAINKADILTLSDAIGKAFGLSKSDTITLSDIFSKSLGGQLFINLSDTITLSDSLSTLLSGMISIISIKSAEAYPCTLSATEYNEMTLTSKDYIQMTMTAEDSV